MMDMIKMERCLLSFSDFVFMKERALKRISERCLPYGVMLLFISVCLVSLLSMQPIYFMAIPVTLAYAIVYSLILHLSVKPEFREPGSYGLTMDNTVLSFVWSSILSTIIAIPLSLALSLFGVANIVEYAILIVFCILFFFNLLSMSAKAYEGVDLEHLFGANLISFSLFAILANISRGTVG